MTTALRKFLVDFSELRPPSIPAVIEAGAETPVDPVAVRIEEARRAALDEARDEAESRLATLREDHAAHLARERMSWAAHEGDRIATALADGLARLEGRLADMLADLLEPLVAEAVRRKAADDLQATVAGVLANAGAVAVTLTGPDDLTAAVRDGLPGPHQLEIRTSETGDAAIRIGDTHIRTQLEAWTERLRQTLRVQP